MDGSSSTWEESTPTENYQRCGNILHHCETVEEFNEEDIWGGVNDAETEHIGIEEKGCNVVTECRSKGINEGNSSYGNNSPKIPRKGSCDEEKNKGRTAYQYSAPVNIPHWSEIAWKKRNENYKSTSHGILDKHNSDDDEDGSDFERIPPHEVIAKQLSQSETTSSVYEGVGRTLKGRDLSQVRNAVWRRTGFIE